MGLRLPGKKFQSVTWCVLTVIKCVLTRENTILTKPLSIDEQIQAVLFDISKELKVHKIDDDNLIIEMDYEKHTLQLKSILEGYRSTHKGV